MIEFGKTRTLQRLTIGKLGPAYGLDRGRRLVVSLRDGDLIQVKPYKTQRPLQITAIDLYAHLLRCIANAGAMQKLRDRKAKKAERLARQRQKRAEKRLVRN